MTRELAGFGFGPIQAGLFVKEARDSGRFGTLAVSEIDAALVDAVRGNGSRYALNVAWPDGVEAVTVEGVTLLNPQAPEDRARLLGVVERAAEFATSLPSVAFYGRGGACAAARLLAEGLRAAGAGAGVVYTAENHNHAAERLETEVGEAAGAAGLGRPVQYLNTVIGKMSQVVTEPAEIARRGLAPIAPGFPRAFLVESFNRILVSRVRLPGFARGIAAFEEKEDLLPFEEAKLYGHNAAHTLLGLLGARCGAARLSELRGRAEVLERVRRAFEEEAGRALVRRHAGVGDPLFSAAGFRAYAADLMARMTNPHLGDTVERAVRDPLRKLGPSDRLFGALRLCLREGVEPACLAAGALQGLRLLAATPACPAGAAWERLRQGERLRAAALADLLVELWGGGVSPDEAGAVAGELERAQETLARWT